MQNPFGGANGGNDPWFQQGGGFQAPQSAANNFPGHPMAQQQQQGGLQGNMGSSDFNRESGWSVGSGSGIFSLRLTF